MKGAVERKACGPFCLSQKSHWREMAMRVFGVALIGLLSLAPLASVSGTQALSNAPRGVDASRLEERYIGQMCQQAGLSFARAGEFPVCREPAVSKTWTVL